MIIIANELHAAMRLIGRLLFQIIFLFNARYVQICRIIMLNRRIDVCETSDHCLVD